MKEFQLNSLKLNLKGLAFLILVIGYTITFSVDASAISAGLSHNSSATTNAATVFGGAFGGGAFPEGTGGTTTATFSTSGPQSHMIDVYDISIPSTCLSDVVSVRLNSTYISSPSPLPFDEGLGGFVSIGDFTGLPIFWGSATLISGHLGHPSGPTTVVFTGHSANTGQSSVDPSDMVVDAIWSGSAPTGALQVVVVSDADNDSALPDLNVGDTVSMTLPTVDVTYSPTSSCAPTNTPPTITSGSGATASVTIPENTNAVTTVTATDADTLDTLSYSITGGTDQSKFTINPATGELTLNSAPDYENPTDSDNNNTYQVEVTVSDGNGGTAIQTITVTITDINESIALYCPSPYGTTTLLTPSGDCDEDGITNQTEGFDPDGDGNPSTGTAPIDTDGDGKSDYLDLDSDNDGILDTEEKGTLANSSTNPSDVDSDGTPDFRDLDSDNDSTKDVLESGRNNLDTNNDGRIDGTTNTYGIASSAASTTNPKTLASTSLKDSDNNGTPDYRQSSTNAVSVLAKTGQSTITALALATLSLVGAVLAKARRARV